MVKSARTYESSASQADFAEPDQTLIIYDWDDTLCPSCWIQDSQLSFFRAPPKEDRYLEPLQQLERLVEALLVTSQKLGKVVIVTNAQEPWVESSCRHFMPALEPLIRSIPVRYARAVHAGAAASPGSARQRQEEASLHPAMKAASAELERQASQARLGGQRAEAGGGAPGMFGRPPAGAGAQAAVPVPAAEALQDLEVLPQRWKETTFRQELERFYNRYERQSWKNVISIGDSVFERDAVRSCVTARPTRSKRCRTKTAKMLDEPTVEELIRQVKVLHDGIALIVQYDGNLDIEINEQDIDFDMDVIEQLMADDE